MSSSAYKPPPAGWRVFNGQLVADATVGGYFARGQEMRGACDQRDCRRRFSIDFDRLIRKGYAPFPVSELKALLQCRRPGGCAMHCFDGVKGSGLPLSLLARYPNVSIRLRCTECRWEKAYPPGQVAAHLKASATGGEETLHVELMTKLKKPCARCGKSRWACDVMWPEPAGGFIPPRRLNADGLVR
ncbi:MAG TPA: hypothetical protein VFW47_08355 [Phenylobacterium sp.]|nr:hypothetical protein [Phenylobacterium sp.]